MCVLKTYRNFPGVHWLNIAIGVVLELSAVNGLNEGGSEVHPHASFSEQGDGGEINSFRNESALLVPIGLSLILSVLEEAHLAECLIWSQIQ